ncbi:hypothetical protein LTR16_011985, partial [Cryomyces antarcticus]
LALRQARELGCGHRRALLRRRPPPQSRPGWLRRRPVHVPARGVQQGGAEARRGEQGEAAGAAAVLPAGRADTKAVHRRDDRMVGQVWRISCWGSRVAPRRRNTICR